MKKTIKYTGIEATIYEFSAGEVATALAHYKKIVLGPDHTIELCEGCKGVPQHAELVVRKHHNTGNFGPGVVVGRCSECDNPMLEIVPAWSCVCPLCDRVEIDGELSEERAAAYMARHWQAREAENE